jgi:GxxExxY protein
MLVHSEQDCGFLEAVYQVALAIEFQKNGIPFNQKINLNIYFRNIKLNKKYIDDFICDEKILLELKAISNITVEQEAHYSTI